MRRFAKRPKSWARLWRDERWLERNACGLAMPSSPAFVLVNESIRFGDTRFAALGVRVRPSGNSTYVLLRNIEGKSKRVSLGSITSRSVDDVRRECHAIMAKPLSAHLVDTDRSALPFRDFVLGPWKDTCFIRYKPSTRRYLHYSLSSQLLPAFGSTPIDRITRNHVHRWVRRLQPKGLAAEQGDAVAQFNLGFMYNNGRGVPEDDAEAVHAQTARTCIYGHLEECNAQRLSTSSLRRRLRLTLDDPVRPPHHPTDNPVVSV